MADISYHFQTFIAPELLNPISHLKKHGNISFAATVHRTPGFQCMHATTVISCICIDYVCATAHNLSSLHIFHIFLYDWIPFFLTIYSIYLWHLILYIFSPLTHHILLTIKQIITITSELFSSSLSYALHKLTYLSGSTEPCLPESTAKPCSQMGLGESFCTNPETNFSSILKRWFIHGFLSIKTSIAMPVGSMIYYHLLSLHSHAKK